MTSYVAVCAEISAWILRSIAIIGCFYMGAVFEHGQLVVIELPAHEPTLADIEAMHTEKLDRMLLGE